MENVCAVPVDVDAVDLFRVYISADVISLLNDGDLLPRLLRLVGENRPEESGSYHEIIHMVAPLKHFPVLLQFPAERIDLIQPPRIGVAHRIRIS